jgi:hypothetical protein
MTLLRFAQKYNKGARDRSISKDIEESTDRSGVCAKAPVSYGNVVLNECGCLIALQAAAGCLDSSA